MDEWSKHTMSHVEVAGDKAATKGKARLDAGERLKWNRVSRPFYCRMCGVSVEAEAVPENWYSLTRHQGRDAPPVRLGVYCSVRCLVQRLPVLRGIEADMGEEWQRKIREGQ